MTTDVLIIGAGPVGLFAGFYAGMRNMDSIIVDQLEVVGGQLSALYPEKEIYDVAGFTEIKAKDLINNLSNQLERFKDKNKILLNTQVENIIKDNNGDFNIETSNGEIKAKSIIIAGGNGGFSPRKLGLENESELDIDYFIKDKKEYKDKNIAIFGGGDSAVDFSLMLEGIAKDINIIHRREEFRAHAHSVDLLKKSSVNIHTPYKPKSCTKIGDKYEIEIESSEKTKKILVDKIICNFGFVSKLGPIENFGLEILKNKIIVNSKQETNIKGIFAIGDICSYEGKANLIITGFGESPIAINHAYSYINPEEGIKSIHSSSIIGGKSEK